MASIDPKRRSGKWLVRWRERPNGPQLTKAFTSKQGAKAFRAKVEHVFRVMKCQFGYRKVRYRGIAKNGAQVFALLALANLFLARRTLASA